jgi:hypothetical protein
LERPRLEKRHLTPLPVTANAHAVDFNVTGILIYVNLFDKNLFVNLLGADQGRYACNAEAALLRAARAQLGKGLCSCLILRDPVQVLIRAFLAIWLAITCG